MLGGAKLKVCYTHEKTCFAYISSKYTTNNDQCQCVHAIWKGSKLLLWVVYSNSLADGLIAVNPLYAKLLSLQDGADLYVSPYADVKILDELFVEPDSPDDQEILEHNVELLQFKLLDQLRVVVANQKAVVWISPSIPIIFTPKQTGILVNHSKVVVKLDAFSHIDKPTKHATQSGTGNVNFTSLSSIHNDLLAKYLESNQKLVLRALPIATEGAKNSLHPYKIFLHEKCIPSHSNERVIATISTIPSITQNDKENDERKHLELCVELFLVNSLVYKSLAKETYNDLIPTCIVPNSLNDILNIESGSKVIINTINKQLPLPEHIEINFKTDPNIVEEKNIVEKFKNELIKCRNSGKIIIINTDVSLYQKEISKQLLQFKIKPDVLKYCVMNEESLRECTISARAADLANIQSTNFKTEVNTYCRSLYQQESLLKTVLQHLQFEKSREAIYSKIMETKGNILVSGAVGSGKSSLCNIIKKELSIFTHILQCRSMKGRKDIPEIFGKAILTCQEHSPSLLICDDIDCLVPESTDGAAPADIAYYHRLAVVIKSFLQTCTGVTVLMTSLSTKSLHPVWRNTSGKSLYTAHLRMQELAREERIQLLKFILNDRLNTEFEIEEDDITRMGVETAGYSCREIIDYVNRRIYKAIKRKCASTQSISPRLVEDQSESKELEDTFNIWEPIGGMESVIQELTECIFWPIMYPALFPSQSCGILLYGPPGTGKSYIGSCLAKLTNMNFISVKGPELLSKYIGQSEKAVRDIFDKADMKRPCILFFDEFDSLAPKRGHDSTGVTDRVVNQLLSRLDGAEGGAHGPVLAATSRPDLVDPALLRPGRLQRHIYCALPDQKERLEVLKKLAGSVNLSPAVDLAEISRRTEGFSPADLKALLVTAQLSCLEKQLDKASDQALESIEVGEDDVENALAETKPSLSREQKIYYDMIYKKFRGEKLTSAERKAAFGEQKQRVTLA